MATTEKDVGGDAPLIDLNEASIKKLIARAKRRGVITVDELNVLGHVVGSVGRVFAQEVGVGSLGAESHVHGGPFLEKADGRHGSPMFSTMRQRQ